MNHYRKSEASRYRAIQTRVWDACGGLDSDAFKLFMYLWFGLHSTQYGILRVKDAYILDDLNWTAARLRKAWKVLADTDLVWRDQDLVVVVPFLDSNPPPNENVIKGWRKQVALLPDSPLFGRLYEKALAWVHEEGLAWLIDKLPKPFQNGSETVPELRIQDAGPRAQAPVLNNREKGAGGIQGGTGGGPTLANPSPIPLPNRSLNPLQPSPSTDCSTPSVDPRLLKLFSHQDPAKARELARKSGRSEAEIQAAEQEAARVRAITQGNA